MGGRVGNQMLWQSCVESILKDLDEGILEIELNCPQSVSYENV
jgi:hypothetical protein